MTVNSTTNRKGEEATEFGGNGSVSVGKMGQLDTRRTIEIGLSRWSMVLPLVSSLALICAAAFTLSRWDIIIFEPSGLIVDLLIDATLLLLMLLSIWGLFLFGTGFANLAWLTVFHRGSAVTISPVGITDSRMRVVEIPWKSILHITPQGQMGTKFLLLTVDPAVYESIVSKENWLPKLYRWLSFCRRAEGDSTIQISPTNLQIGDDDFWDLILAYAHAHGRYAK